MIGIAPRCAAAEVVETAAEGSGGRVVVGVAVAQDQRYGACGRPYILHDQNASYESITEFPSGRYSVPNVSSKRMPLNPANSSFRFVSTPTNLAGLFLLPQPNNKSLR